jgi:hypothetical protein
MSLVRLRSVFSAASISSAPQRIIRSLREDYDPLFHELMNWRLRARFGYRKRYAIQAVTMCEPVHSRFNFCT